MCLDAFVKCFRKHVTFCQFVTKRGSLLGEMILFPKLPKGEFVSLKYWLSFVIKMKRKRAKRSDGIHCRSEVMQSRTSVLKPESSVRRPVRSPFGRLRTRRAKIEECDVRKRWKPRNFHIRNSDRPNAHHDRPNSHCSQSPISLYIQVTVRTLIMTVRTVTVHNAHHPCIFK
jgi:hypothetical protein